MKILLLLLLSALGCLAQNDRIPVVATNFVTAGPNYRVFNGRLYNTEFSSNWTDVAGVVVDVSDEENILVSNAEKQTCFILKNYTDFRARAAQISTKAICFGTNNWNGELGGIYPAYDCGQPHRVLIVTTNYVSPKTQKPAVKASSSAPPVVTRPWES
jgi:hypothetical protein